MKKLINEAHLENSTYRQILTHFEQDSEVRCLEVPIELLVNTVKQHATKPNPENPYPTCHDCKKTRSLSKKMPSAQNRGRATGGNEIKTENNNNAATISKPTNNNSHNNNKKQNNRNDRKLRTVYSRCETFGKTNHVRESCYSGANAANRLPPE